MIKVVMKKDILVPFHYFVICGTIIKLFLMAIFSSDYQNKLFYPFIMDFIDNGGNVWQRFYDNGIYNAFPYPVVMLIVESIGGMLIKILGISNLLGINFCLKLPSFILDIIGFRYLVKLCQKKRRYIAVFFYMSPILLYGAYIHSQLDIIPMTFLIIALYYLVSKNKDTKRYTLGSVFMVLSLLSKLHILAVVPIVIFYLAKRDGIKKAFYFGTATAIGCAVGILPFMSEGFMQNVLFNTEQSVLTQVYFSFDTVQMYIPIVAVLVVYLLAYKTSFINRDLFFSLCGIVFAVFLAFCPPMPGWYIWIVPFFAIFFACANEEKYKNIVIYTSMNLWFLFYFTFFHNKGYVDIYWCEIDCSFLKFHNRTISNLLFTLLSGTLLYLIVSMYKVGIAGNSLYKGRNIPFTIGIAGDSGTGKTSIISIIEKCIGSKNLLQVEGDGDHKWERDNKSWDDYTALNPKANYLYRQAEDLKQLRTGNAILRVDYDHSTGRFTSPRKMRSKNYVILCGLHSMYLPQTRKYLDLKIYMDSDEKLRRYWKIQRDTEQRGHSKDAVLKSIEERMPDAEKYIYPQKNYADLIVRYFDKTLQNCTDENHDVQMSVTLTIDSAVNVEPLIDELQRYGLVIDYDYSDDLQKQIVNIYAENFDRVHLPIEIIAEKIIPQLESITRENLSGHINGLDGVLILFILLMISSKMQGVM